MKVELLCIAALGLALADPQLLMRDTGGQEIAITYNGATDTLTVPQHCRLDGQNGCNVIASALSALKTQVDSLTTKVNGLETKVDDLARKPAPTPAPTAEPTSCAEIYARGGRSDGLRRTPPAQSVGCT